MRCLRLLVLAYPEAAGGSVRPRVQSSVVADHAAGVFADRFPGHAAAFAGDRRALGKWLDATPRDDWARHDPQGMTVAHLAVLRGHLPCLELLLSRGFPIDAEDARGWVVLEDAIAKRDRAATRAIMERKVRFGKRNGTERSGRCGDIAKSSIACT